MRYTPAAGGVAVLAAAPILTEGIEMLETQAANYRMLADTIWKLGAWAPRGAFDTGGHHA